MGLVSKLRFALQSRSGRTKLCPHLDQIHDVERGSQGCLPCIELGDTWVHLRMCMSCGTVGCCDSSKNKHAHQHANEIGHQVVRSLEPGEDWLWCFADETFVAAP